LWKARTTLVAFLFLLAMIVCNAKYRPTQQRFDDTALQTKTEEQPFSRKQALVGVGFSLTESYGFVCAAA